jgi:hypothetical protein
MEIGTLAVGDLCIVVEMAFLSLFYIWIKLFLHVILDGGVFLWNSDRCIRWKYMNFWFWWLTPWWSLLASL